MCADHATRLETLLAGGSFDGDYLPNEPMARNTTYRIGGPARHFIVANSVSALSAALRACEEDVTPWTVVGRGSNLLVSDEGYPGAVIMLGRDFRTFRFDEEAGVVSAGAGVLLATVVQEAFRRSFSGFEFAVGTPGTIGGAIRMNAGTRDAWIGHRVISVTTYRPGAGIAKRPGTDIAWGYRSTDFASDEVILECELRVEPADAFYVRGKMEALLSKRRKSQPLTQPSCGSVFKNPENRSAGELIDKAGCKGYSVGGAQVSPVHANFIVNTGGATATDVCAVMDHVRSEVSGQFGVLLVPEVQMLGFAETAGKVG